MLCVDYEGNTKKLISKVQTTIPQTDKITVIGPVESFDSGQGRDHLASSEWKRKNFEESSTLGIPIDKKLSSTINKNAN
jgi:hypothetical protein